MALMGLPFAFWLWWFFSRFPTRIDWDERDCLHFTGLGLSVEISAGEIESIRPDTTLGFLALRYRGGKKLRLLNQFDGFHEFLSRLQAANPRVELRGC